MNIETKSDLENLIINQIEENIHLDYKAGSALGKSDGKKDEISRDVSAFANSNGGVIIYGIAEFDEKGKSHLPEKIDGINRTEFSKEWLENIINGRISPRIDGIKIISIQESTNSVIYVVNIPKSTTAHQASDFRYYKRSNFGKNPMYDYEVKDVMNRNKFPKIDLLFNVEHLTYEVKSFSPPMPSFHFPFQKNEIEKEYKTYISLIIYAFNEGSIYTNYVNCFLEIPSSLLDEKEYLDIDKYEKNNILYQKIYCDNTVREVKEVTTLMNNSYPKYWPSRYDPILPDTKMKLKEIKLKSNIEISSGIIYWSVNADNSEKVTGEIEFNNIVKITKKV